MSALKRFIRARWNDDYDALLGMAGLAVLVALNVWLGADLNDYFGEDGN